MTPDQLAQARAICDAATPGPWTVHSMLGLCCDECAGEYQVLASYPLHNYKGMHRTFDFLRHARVGYPAALDEIERLQKPGRETGWLIERWSSSGPLYITADEFGTKWTSDHLAAIRFSRREDAERMCLFVEDAEKITQHEWGAFSGTGATR